MFLDLWICSCIIITSTSIFGMISVERERERKRGKHKRRDREGFYPGMSNMCAAKRPVVHNKSPYQISQDKGLLKYTPLGTSRIRVQGHQNKTSKIKSGPRGLPGMLLLLRGVGEGMGGRGRTTNTLNLHHCWKRKDPSMSQGLNTQIAAPKLHQFEISTHDLNVHKDRSLLAHRNTQTSLFFKVHQDMSAYKKSKEHGRWDVLALGAKMHEELEGCDTPQHAFRLLSASSKLYDGTNASRSMFYASRSLFYVSGPPRNTSRAATGVFGRHFLKTRT